MCQEIPNRTRTLKLQISIVMCAVSCFLLTVVAELTGTQIDYAPAMQD